MRNVASSVKVAAKWWTAPLKRGLVQCSGLTALTKVLIGPAAAP